MSKLAGRIALVTGASRGIGRAIAIALAREGADVAVNYLTREAEAREVCGEIEGMGRHAAMLAANVSIGVEVGAMVRHIEQQLGAVTILVNNAGISRRQPLDQITEQDWDEVVDANLKSAFLVTQAVLPGMRTQQWGRIINLSSVAAQNGGVVGPHYASSKAGMIGLTHSYASLLTKEGITVNAIAPALIQTEMLGNISRSRVDLIPVGRFGSVEEVADVAVLLATNGYITGQTISVNGGWYMS
jgi:3-oxoacyl-[acyl-carrier protein] reductase